MDNTQFDELPRMKAIVEEYIYKRTGRKIHIVFDDVFSMRKHAQMLAQAYSYVLAQEYKND
jgi:beta-lactamase class A